MPASKQKLKSTSSKMTEVKKGTKSEVNTETKLEVKNEVKPEVKSKKVKVRDKTVKPKSTKSNKAVKTKRIKEEPKQKEDDKVEIKESEQVGSGLVDPDNAGTSKKRYFRCIYSGETYGRLCGKKPKQAANKAFTSLLKHMKKSKEIYNGQKINFSIVECTRNSKHNKYCYIGERKALAKPVIVTINVKDDSGAIKEKKVTYHHKNYVKKVKKADMEAEPEVDVPDAKTSY